MEEEGEAPPVHRRRSGPVKTAFADPRERESPTALAVG
jgi:hypothetical protein